MPSKDQEMTAEFIFHLADIHIGSNQNRSVEYRKVFDKVFARINSFAGVSKSIVIIAGDIFHRNDVVSAQDIADFNYLLEGIRIPVLIIPGNHDGSVENPDKEDLLRPILKDKSCTYVRNSGFFKFCGHMFYHVSVFDNGRTPEIIMKELNYGNEKYGKIIMLYHGMLVGSKFSNNLMRPPKISMEIINNVFMLIAGDIHQHQFMAPHAAYSGSLIQQKLGDPMENGMIIWNITERRGQFIPIENDHGFVKIIADPNTNFDDMLANIQIPKHTERLVFVPSASSNEEIVNQVAAIEKKVGRKIDHLNLSYINKANLKRDIDVKEGIARDIREFLKIPAKPEEIEKVLALHEEEPETKMVRRKWVITRMAWSNYFKYGEENCIDFTSIQGVIGIMGPNAIGKSSILELILYGLFSETNGVKPYMVNAQKENDKKTGYLRIDFEVNDKKYYVERCDTRGSSHPKYILHAFEDGKWESKGSNVDATAKEMRDLLGTSSEFLSTCAWKQGDYWNDLVGMSATDRSKCITNLFAITSIDRIIAKYKKLIKDDQGTIDSFEVIGMSSGEIVEKIKTTRNSINAADENLSKASAKRKEVDEKTEGLGFVKDINLDETERKLIEVKRKISINAEKLNASDAITRGYDVKELASDLRKNYVVKNINQLKKDIQFYEAKGLGSREEYSNSLASCEQNRAVLLGRIGNYASRLPEFYEIRNRIPSMKQQITELQKKADMNHIPSLELNKMLGEINGKLQSAENRLSIDNRELERLNSSLRQIGDVNHLRTRYDELCKEIMRLESISSRDPVSNLYKVLSNIEVLSHQLTSVHRNLSDLPNIDHNAIKAVKDRIDIIDVQLSTMSVETVDELREKISCNNREITDMKSQMKSEIRSSVDSLNAKGSYINECLGLKFNANCHECKYHKELFTKHLSDVYSQEELLSVELSDIKKHNTVILQKISDVEKLNDFIAKKIDNILVRISLQEEKTRLQEKVEELNKCNRQSENLRDKYNHEIREIESRLAPLTKEKEKFEGEIKCIQPLPTLRGQKIVLDDEIYSVESSINDIKSQIKKLEQSNEKNNSDIKSLLLERTKLESSMKISREIEDSLTKLRDMREELKAALENVERIPDIEEYHLLNSDIPIIKENLEDVIALDKCRDDLRESEKQIVAKACAENIELHEERKLLLSTEEKLLQIVNDAKKNAENLKKLASLKEEKKNIDMFISTTIGLKSRLLFELEQLEEKEKKATEYEEKCTILNERMRIHSLYYQWLKSARWQKFIVEEAIGLVLEQVNNILRSFTDIEITVNGERLGMQWLVKSRGVERPLSMLSGFEKFLVGMLLRLVLSRSLMSSAEFIFIDEGFGCADKNNLRYMKELFSKVQAEYRFVALISHVDEMKDIVEYPLRVINRNGSSHISNAVCPNLKEMDNYVAPIVPKAEHFLQTNQLSSNEKQPIQQGSTTTMFGGSPVVFTPLLGEHDATSQTEDKLIEKLVGGKIEYYCPICQKPIPKGRAASHLNTDSHKKNKAKLTKPPTKSGRKSKK